MPRRKTPLISGEYYHLFNRGVNKAPIFHGTRGYRRAYELLMYYQFNHPPLKYSEFRDLSPPIRQDLWARLAKDENRLVDLIAYCLMPNHYHFLVRQRKEGGISHFVANWQNALAKYMNTRLERTGPLFQGPFRAVRVEDDEQLLHLSRYIHLNPYTSHVVDGIDALLSYPWSSVGEYIGTAEKAICTTDVVLIHFANKALYRSFLTDSADYQRTIAAIKHLTLE